MSSEWQPVRLGDYCDVNPTKRDKDWPFDALRYIDISSVGEGALVENAKEIPVSDAPSRAQRLVKPGDTIVSTVRPNRRSMLFLRNSTPDTVVSTGFAVLRAKKNKMNERFLYYLVFDPAFTDYLVSKAEGSAYPAVNPVAFEEAKISFPPLPEQERIAAVLAALDNKIELNHRLNENLESLANATFKSWFIDFDPVHAKMSGQKLRNLSPDIASLFPNKLVDSPMGKIPKGWEVDEIGNLIDTVGGATPSTGDASYWDGGTIFWATPKDLSFVSSHVLLDTERKITKKGLAKISSGVLPAGTVLLSSRAPIGYLAVAEIPVAINQGFIAMKPTGILGTQYILHWALHNMETVKSRANGSTFQEISKRAFRPILVCRPPKPLLDAFESIAGSLHAHVVQNIKQNRNLASSRDALLPKLLSGELRVAA